MQKRTADEVLVTGAFDNLRFSQIRFLQEAAGFGPVTVQLWSDQLVDRIEGKAPKFPETERLYFLRAIRWVDEVTMIDTVPERSTVNRVGGKRAGVWVVAEPDHSPEKENFCNRSGLRYAVIKQSTLNAFPDITLSEATGVA